jgi:DDE family transposase
VISTVDPDARHTRKSPEARRDGYRAHVAAEPQTGLITDEELTRAAGEQNADAAVAGQMIARQAEAATVYGDSAYGTGDLRAALAEGGHSAVIKPGPLRPAVEGGFTIDDFTVGEAVGTVTCPAGLTRPGSARRYVTFGAGCASAAPPPEPAAPCNCTPTTHSCARPAPPGPPSLRCARTTTSTGPTWSGRSPRSPAAAAGASNSATSASPRTTPGSSTAPPPQPA